METLKMKFKLHSLEFEIEGKETTVKEEFQNFKNFITGELLSKINVVAPTITTISSTPTEQFTPIPDFIPTNSKPPHKGISKMLDKKNNKTAAKSVKIEQFDIFKSLDKPALEDFLKENSNVKILIFFR